MRLRQNPACAAAQQTIVSDLVKGEEAYQEEMHAFCISEQGSWKQGAHTATLACHGCDLSSSPPVPTKVRGFGRTSS